MITETNHSSFRDNRSTYIVLFLILLLAAWLRFYQLGMPALERNHDEDIMATAVMGIQEYAYPLMPGGMVYLRSAPLLYLMAGSVELLGLSEFSLRLPAAVFGLLLVPLGYLVARRYFGHACGITAAVLIACSFWEVEVSRTARMYTPFAFFYTLSVYGICRGYLERSLAWRWAAIPLAVLTIAMHKLGFTLGAVLALAAAAPRLTIVGRMTALGSAAIAGVWFLYWDSVQGAGFVKPRTLASMTEMSDAVKTEDGSVLSKITDRLYFPEDLLFAKPELSARVLLIAGLIGGALLIFFLLRRSPALKRPWPVVLLIACVLAGVTQQFILASVLFAAFILVQGRGLQTILQPSTMSVAGFMALLFIGWFLLGITGSAGVELSTYDTLRALLDYPKAEVIRRFVLERPFMMLLAGIGMAFALHRASQQRLLTPQAFLAVTIVVALVLHGVFESQFRGRYNFNLDVLYLIFVAAGSVHAMAFAVERLHERLPVPGMRQTAAVALPMVVATLVSLPDLRPATSFAYVNSWEGSSADWAERHRLAWPVDRKSTATYVRTHAAPEDEVLTMDWMTSYFYAGKVNYWLRSSGYVEVSYSDGERWRDMYLGALVVPDGDALNDLLAQPCRNTLWIITSGWVMLKQPHKLSPEISRIIDEMKLYLVYTGLDGVSAVYRIPVQGVCQRDRHEPV